MAEPLKRFFDRSRVEIIADMLAGATKRFPHRAFVEAASRGLDNLELMDRARHISRAMKASLPDDYEEAIDVMIRSLGPELDDTEGLGMSVFVYLPHVLFVAEHGLDHFDASMRAQHELTRRFSAEFSIRAYLDRHTEATLAKLESWADDPNRHVRRLVSEGTRPRLPWAPRLPKFQRDPTPVIALLERLKDDPDLYVRRSVANNLNDIGKDHPDVLLDVCERWSKDASEERSWVIEHALRSSIKKGDRRALAITGVGDAKGLSVKGTISPTRPTLGGSIRLDIEVTSTRKKATKVTTDLVVHFMKSNGETRPKVFKGKTIEIAASSTIKFGKSVSLADLTTRKHYPGKHRVEALLNGTHFEIGEFTAVAAPKSARSKG